MSMITRSHITRLKVVALLGILFWVLLIGKLFYIQVIKSGKYAEQANEIHKRKIVLEAKRGSIFDRNFRRLADNLMAYTFVADPLAVKNPWEVTRRFSQLTGRKVEDLYNILKARRSFAWLARKVDYETAQRIRSWKLDGVRELVENRRYYPLGSCASQLIGYTDIDNRGIEGVELAVDRFLSGQPGWMIVQVDAKGRRFPDIGSPRSEPIDGADVVLTICSIYQAIVEAELSSTIETFDAESGTAVMMNPCTGEIYAMANVPQFDPNSPESRGQESRKERTTINRIITDTYEPGSTFKIVTAATTLEHHLKKPTDKIFCENGVMLVGGRPIHDAHEYGWLSFQEVVEHSSNIGTIKVAQELGEKKIYEYARAFGFASETGVDLLGEVKGVVPHPSKWSKRSLASIAIGQEVSVTALQLASAYCAIANGGLLMKPRIVKEIVSKDGKILVRSEPQIIRRVISTETAKTMVQFLEGVVERGTGKNAKIEGFSVGGKTGTAQRTEEGQKGYASGQFVSSFVGFLPANNPRLVCLVTVNAPKGQHYGSEVAAPTFKRIIDRILSLRHCPLREELQPDRPDSTRLKREQYVYVPALHQMPRETTTNTLKQ